MPVRPDEHGRRLSRLAPENYRGFSFVHWSMTTRDRAAGWLDVPHHARVREILCHALGRHLLLCPAYCLMPDHAHFLWVGWSAQSDQRRAVRLFREAWNAELTAKGVELQRQAYDHVLREFERERDAFAAVAHYIFENPVRRGLAREWLEYQYLGALAPGYPNLDPRSEGYWGKFWRIHARLVGEL